MSLPTGEEQLTTPNSFGFKVSRETLGLMVHLEYNDHAKKRGTPLQIHIDGYASGVYQIDNGIEFDMPCTVRSLDTDNSRELNYCHIRMQDNAQQGTGNEKNGTPADAFYLEVTDGPQAPYSSGESGLIRGNIRVH